MYYLGIDVSKQDRTPSQAQNVLKIPGAGKKCWRHNRKGSSHLRCEDASSDHVSEAQIL